MSRSVRRLRSVLLDRRSVVDEDVRREERVARVLRLAERFVYDLGLLIAGRVPDMHDYVATTAAGRLHDALRPLDGAAAVICPEFSEYAQVRIEGDLLDTAAPVRSVVEFEDRSTRVDEDGGPVARTRRRVRLLLLFDPAITMVIDHRIDIA